MKYVWIAPTLAACSSAAPPAHPQPVADSVEILAVPKTSELGNVVALLPDGRGLVQRSGDITIVDPATGNVVGPHPAPLPSAPKYGCDLRRWGATPALICDIDALYRLGPSGWQEVTRAESDDSMAVELSDDGVHAAYLRVRCPGEPEPTEKDWREGKLCMFGRAGWRKVAFDGRASLVAIRGATAFVVLAESDNQVRRIGSFDAETGAAGPEVALPPYNGAAVAWTTHHLADMWTLPEGVVYLTGTPNWKFDATGPGAAGVMAMRRSDGSFVVHETTDAPRERWGVRVAFADSRHGIAAGSFYRNIYYTMDGGAHWTAVAGLDATRDTLFPKGRIVEDGAMEVHCDVTRTCRVTVHRTHDLVFRFAGPR